MRGDLGVGALLEGGLERLARLPQVALAKLHPAQAVLDVGIVGRQLHRLVDQGAGFRQAQVAIGQRVAQRVVGLRGFGLELDQPAQQPLHRVELAHPLGGRGGVVQQGFLVGRLLQRAAQQVVGLLGLTVVTQQLGLGQQLQPGVLGIALGHGANQLPRFVQPALARQQLRQPRLHGERLLG